MGLRQHFTNMRARRAERSAQERNTLLFESVFYPVTKTLTASRLWGAGLSMLSVYVVGVLGYWLIGEGRWALEDCLYMVVITITTVGYGEVIPISESPYGVWFTMGLLISGLGVSAYFLSALTAYILEGDLREAIWRRKMEREILSLRGHHIVCGAGEVGQSVVEQLVKGGRQVVVLEMDEERLARITRRFPGVLALVGDATEDELLKACGVERAAGLVSALQLDRDNLFVVVSARQMQPSLRIVARATNDRAATKITRAGADVVVCPTTIGGLRMASELMRPSVVGFLDLIVRDSQDNQLTVEELEVPRGSPLHGVRLRDSKIRQVGNVLVLSALKDKVHRFNPPSDLLLEEGMTLVALGETPDLARLQAYLRGQRVTLNPLPVEAEGAEDAEGRAEGLAEGRAEGLVEGSGIAGVTRAEGDA